MYLFVKKKTKFFSIVQMQQVIKPCDKQEEDPAIKTARLVERLGLTLEEEDYRSIFFSLADYNNKFYILFFFYFILKI